MDGPAKEPDLRVIQAVYAVLMALGFRAIVESGYVFASPLFGTSAAALRPLVYVLPAVAITFLGLRFFWAVVNVRRYLERVRNWINNLSDSSRADKLRKHAERMTIAIHVTVLIAHGLMFYFACKLAADIMILNDAASLSRGFILFYAAFQAFNVVWLIALLSARHELFHLPFQREHFWIANNLASSTAAVFVASHFSILGTQGALALACGVFVASSVADLWFTSHHYLESPERRPQG